MGMGIGGGGGFDDVDVEGSKNEALAAIQEGLDKGLPYSEKYTDKAIGAVQTFYEQARRDLDRGDKISQARQAPYNMAAGYATDFYLDSLGVPRAEMGSFKLAQALETGERVEAARNEARDVLAEYYPIEHVGGLVGARGFETPTLAEAGLRLMKGSDPGYAKALQEYMATGNDQALNNLQGNLNFGTLEGGDQAWLDFLRSSDYHYNQYKGYRDTPEELLAKTLGTPNVAWGPTTGESRAYTPQEAATFGKMKGAYGDVYRDLQNELKYYTPEKKGIYDAYKLGMFENLGRREVY